MDVFEALAEPNRRALLDLLVDGAHSAGELEKATPELTQSAVSRHLKALKEAGLVEVEVQGPRRIYSLRPQGFAELNVWLRRYQRFWRQNLDDLEAHLAAVHGKPSTKKRAPR